MVVFRLIGTDTEIIIASDMCVMIEAMAAAVVAVGESSVATIPEGDTGVGIGAMTPAADRGEGNGEVRQATGADATTMLRDGTDAPGPMVGARDTAAIAAVEILGAEPTMPASAGVVKLRCAASAETTAAKIKGPSAATVLGGKAAAPARTSVSATGSGFPAGFWATVPQGRAIVANKPNPPYRRRQRARQQRARK